LIISNDDEFKRKSKYGCKYGLEILYSKVENKTKCNGYNTPTSLLCRIPSNSCQVAIFTKESCEELKYMIQKAQGLTGR